MINPSGDGDIVMIIALHAQDQEMIMITNVIHAKLTLATISIVIKLKDMVFQVLAIIIAKIMDFS
jgi:hypothetical protein